MKVSLEPNDREFLEQLHRLGPASVQQICREIGVTATAVRQRLSRLQGMNYVSREMVRTGRGRPHHVYRVTETGLRQLGDNYGDLAMVLWRSLLSIEEPEVRQRVINRIQQALVDRYGKVSEAETLDERVEQLRQELEERGFDVEVDSSGDLPILRENNCPYLELAGYDSTICQLEQAVFGDILGAEVSLRQCCLDGHHCCEFQAKEEPQHSA